MKLTEKGWLRCAARQTRQSSFVAVLIAITLLGMAWMRAASAQAVSTTTVQGTVYLANGQAGSGTLRVSWPAFATANGLAVAADSTTVKIAPDGFVSVNLAPNLGATPAGLYYTAVFYMSDGSTSTEYWVVPSAAQASLAQVQSQLMPAAQAVQAVSKAYVDQSISELSQGLLTASGGTLNGPLYLNGDPTQALQASDKHYVDTAVGQAVPLSGGNMTGALSAPAVNGVQAPTANSSEATLQAAMTAAGTSGAMEIPPTYAGTDGFTNPNGVRVTDLRSSGAQQSERSVKEFGAVCDGVTDDTNALQAALNYAQTHGVALTIPQGTCKTRTLNWHGESIGGMGKQVSALLGYPGQDVLASLADSPNLLQNTRLHDLTIYVDQSVDVSCSPVEGRASAGNCAVNRPLESNSIFSQGGSGLAGVTGTGAGWAVGNCAIAMPAEMGTGGNGLRVAEIENVEIATTGMDPMVAQYPGARSTHTCGMYLAQWPQWSEFRNIDIRGVNTGIAMPALPGTAPAGLNADSNRWENITIQAAHGFTAAAGSNNVLDNVVALAGNSSAAAEPPTGLVLDLTGTQQGWTVRNAVVIPSWNVVQPQLTVTTAGGAVTGVAAGSEHGLGFDPYGSQVPLKFSGSCTAAASANVNSDGSIGTISVTQGGAGCSGTTTANVNVAGNWDTAAAVNLIGGQGMTFFAGNLLKGNGGYTVWNAAGSESYGTQLNGGGGTLPGGGGYAALVGNNRVGTTYEVDQFPGADFGAKLQSCLSAVSAQYGGECDARNFTGSLSMGSNLTISTGNTTVQLPCATIATAYQIIVTAGTRNVALRGCALRGGSAASGSQGGTVFQYSGTRAMVQVGDPTYATDTQGFHMDDVVINTTAASSATAQGLVAYRTQEMDLESLYFLGNANQTGMTLDGTGNYTGGTYFDNALNGFQTAVNAIGHQVSNAATTDWMNASAFVRLHIDCPTSAGNPIAGTYGINLQQGDGNTFTGGDVEGCATALHLGANAQNNTIVGLRNENSTSQVVADAGSSYNNWITGGTMFTGRLTDNGTRNSFLDTFHRSFNGMNGDWYGSQQDATVTNHWRLGTATGNERGLLNRYQTDYGYRWTMGLSDATAGEQFYQVLDELNNVYRFSIGQYNNGQPSTNNQTVINAAGTGAVVLNGSNNAGTGGVVIGSGGASVSTVASISNAGNAQFNGSLQVGGSSTFAGSTTVRNQTDAEIDQLLWAGATASQKESLTYKDWNGNSQWYAVKDASNNWALNSAIGGLDSFKAYQSTNSGDTYVNASNASGVVRVNYENGAGTGFKIYGGGSSPVYASFTGAASIQFPGLAAGSGHNCLQIDDSGYVTNTGLACGTGSGGSGTVSSANLGQIAYYTGNGTSIGGMTTVPVSAGGTGSSTAAAALLTMGGISSTSSSPQTIAGSLITSTNTEINVQSPPYNAVCDGVTDDTAAIQAALYAAGLNTFSTIPAEAYFGVASVNKPQGTLVFPANKTCRIAAPLIVPPGVTIDLNNATLHMTAAGTPNADGSSTGDALQISYNNIAGTPNSLGAPWFNQVKNGAIQGPGAGSSTGSGIFTLSANVANFENLNITGFKFGIETQGLQYSSFKHVYASANVVGFYLTAISAFKNTFPTLDDTFVDIVADNNLKYGVWGQDFGASTFMRADISSNGEAEVVRGSQLGPYISSITYSGGSGCLTSSNIPLTITDGTGTMAQAYISTTSGGVPNGAWVVDGGQGYVSPTVALTTPANCTVPPTLIAHLTNDTGLGAWDGTTVNKWGTVRWEGVKSEAEIGLDLNSGYAVIINASNVQRDTFAEYEFAPQNNLAGAAPSAYARLARTIGYATTFIRPAVPGNILSFVNPAVSSFTDISMFRAMLDGALLVEWGTLSNFQGAPPQYVIDNTGAVSWGDYSATVAIDSSGNHLAKGYFGQSNSTSSVYLQSNVNGDAFNRFQALIDGTLSWGPGSGATDVTLSRTSTGRLTVSGDFWIKGNLIMGPTGPIVIPTGITGYYGSPAFGAVDIQNSDGTGASGNLAAYGSFGKLTNGPTPPVGAIVGTSDSQTLTNKSIAGSEINSGTVGAASGGTGQNESAATGIGQWLSGAYSVSPVLANGTTATTQSANDNSTNVATTKYVANPGAIAPTTVTASGILTAGNDTTRTTSATISTTGFTTTGLVLPAVPVSTIKSGRCVVYWQMSSTSYTATIGIGMSNVPINLWGGSSVTYAATGTSNWQAFMQTAASATAISPATTAGAANTTYRGEVDFTLQTGATNPVSVTVYGEVSNASATLTIQPGSACYWLP